MANGSNLLDEVGQGLGKVLPYALPAALGASLGGIPGALLGAASAMPTQEDYLKQQELQWQQVGRQAQMAFANEPGFQQEVARTFGIDPSHVGALGLMEPKEFTTILEQFGKMRTAKKDVTGIRLPDGTWAQKDNRTGEVTPLPGEPMNAAIAEANQQAATARAAQAQAAALQRTEIAQAGAASREASSEAAAMERTKLSKSTKWATIYDKNDPSNTQLVQVGAGYMPPKGWTLSKPATTKIWSATDALNAVTKANNQAKLEGTKPGAIWGTRPPTPAELIARRRQILLGEHLNPDTGMQLKSGDVVTLPSGKRVKWVD